MTKAWSSIGQPSNYRQKGQTMASVMLTVQVECEVDESVLEEYDNGVMEWAADAVSVDVMDSRYLSYFVDYAEEM